MWAGGGGCVGGRGGGGSELLNESQGHLVSFMSSHAWVPSVASGRQMLGKLKRNQLEKVFKNFHKG